MEGDSINILAVENDPSHLKLAHLVLSAAGLRVSDAEAADKAFASIKLKKSQIIVLDLGLPGVDGLTLVRKLRADPETGDIPVIAITSYPDRITLKNAASRRLPCLPDQAD